MNDIYYLLLIIPIGFVFQFVRFKLTGWEVCYDKFGVEERDGLNFIYGFWSEYRRNKKSYPLSNKFMKVAVTPYGLYLIYDLKFEIIRFYKPILIPWNSLTIEHSQEANTKGCDEYKINSGNESFGSIFLQVPISDEIVKKAEEIGIELDYYNGVNTKV